MPVPALNREGVLPPGVHDSTLDEVLATFGVFYSSDRRVDLGRDLRHYVEQLTRAGVGRYLYVNGSFVTDKPAPSDVDVLLILRDDLDPHSEVPPFEYNVRSRQYLRRKFRIDFFFGFEGDDSSRSILALFRRVKGAPNLEKGFLRIVL